MTSATFAAITLRAYISRWDIEPTQSLLTGVIVCYLTLITVLLVFEDSDVIYLFLSSIPILMALAIVSFDTQIIIRTRRFGITQDDHIAAALLLYIEPILGIVHVLRIVFKC